MSKRGDFSFGPPIEAYKPRPRIDLIQEAVDADTSFILLEGRDAILKQIAEHYGLTHSRSAGCDATLTDEEWLEIDAIVEKDNNWRANSRIIAIAEVAICRHEDKLKSDYPDGYFG